MANDSGIWVFLPKTFYWDAKVRLYDGNGACEALEAEYCRLGWAMFWTQVALAFLMQHHSELHSAETDW